MTVTVQVGAVPEHAPPQLTKRWPAAGVAESVTAVPCTIFAEQVLRSLRHSSFGEDSEHGEWEEMIDLVPELSGH